MESIYLHGSEDVSRAASSMREAAREMQSAASSIQGIFDQYRMFMDDWLQRYEVLMSASLARPNERSEL